MPVDGHIHTNTHARSHAHTSVLSVGRSHRVLMVLPSSRPGVRPEMIPRIEPYLRMTSLFSVPSASADNTAVCLAVFSPCLCLLSASLSFSLSFSILASLSFPLSFSLSISMSLLSFSLSFSISPHSLSLSLPSLSLSLHLFRCLLCVDWFLEGK